MADIGEMSMTHPAAVAFAFFYAVTQENGPDVVWLQQLVTPESLPLWGDFAELPAMVGDLGLSTPGWRAHGRDDVHYVGLMENPPADAAQTVGDLVVAGKVLTLQRRPDLGGEWRVHALGDTVLPEDLPHVP